MATATLPPRRLRPAVRGAHPLRYVVARVGQAVVTAFLAYVLVFVIVTVLPGNPVEASLRSPELGYTDAEIDELLGYYHLDRPVWVQLWYALRRLVLHNDWGISLAAGRPVVDVIADGVPATLQLASVAVVLAALIALVIALGVFHLPADQGGDLLRSFPSLFLSLPNFLIGLVIIDVFAFGLGWFRITDDHGWAALVFPAICLAIPVSAPIAQVLVTALDGARAEQYTTVAVAKGIGRRHLLVRHLLPNAALPTLTITAIVVGDLLGGSMITEAVFGRPGLGSVIAAAATVQDVPVLQAAVTLAAVIFLAINLVVDLIYPYLDPRLRTQAAR